MPDISVIGNFLATDVRMATPIMFAALGLVLSNRSGIINIGYEGIMLVGALMGFTGAAFFDNVWMGLLVAILSGGVMGIIFAFATVTLRANQIVIGAAFNILGNGLTIVLYRIFFGINSQMIRIPTFSNLQIPLLAKIPVLGEALFQHMAPVYLAFFMVFAIWYFLFKTRYGLSLRAVGESPKAADTLGVGVYRIRYLASCVGGMLAAVGGAFLSTGLANGFTENMVNGRGYIALAAVVFGKYSPVGVMGATLLFGLGDAIQITLQASGSNIPPSFLLMFPYIITLVALAGFIGKAVAPAASGKPYVRG